MRLHAAVPVSGHDESTVSDAIVSGCANLLKAAMYMRRKSLFVISGAANDAPQWIAEQPIESIAFTVFQATRKHKDQLLSQQQTEAQAAKASSRITEWVSAWKLKPELISAMVASETFAAEGLGRDGRWRTTAERARHRSKR